MPPAKKATRTWMVVGLALTLTWVAYLAAFGPEARVVGTGAPDLEGSGLAMPADFAWTLLDLDDKPVEFATFRGRPIFLNLWSTRCGPCLEEMPSIARLAEDRTIKEKGVAIVCVSIDRSPEEIRQVLKSRGWGMTFLRATSLPPVFASDGIPATFLIDPDGRVVASQVGPSKWDDPSVVAFLAKLARPAR